MAYNYNYSLADWDGLRDHLRDVLWEDIIKFSASTAASKSGEWVQVGIDVYIPHPKYQVTPHSSPWFLAAGAAAIVHENDFFVCTKRINLRKQKQSSDRLLIAVKGSSKLPYLHMLLKQKTSLKHHFPETWLSGRLVNF